MKTCPGVRTGEMVDLRGTPLYYFEELFLEKNDLDPVGHADGICSRKNEYSVNSLPQQCSRMGAGDWIWLPIINIKY